MLLTIFVRKVLTTTSWVLRSLGLTASQQEEGTSLSPERPTASLDSTGHTQVCPV